MDGLTFRRGGPEDYPALLDLYAVAYGKTFYLDWLRWWNEGGPLANGLRLACDGSRVVAAYGLMPMRLWLNDGQTNASLCNNVCVHPSLQGQGIFTALGMYALAGEIPLRSPVSLGFPNARALPGHLKIGWEVVCGLPEMVKRECEPKLHRCTRVDTFGSECDYLNRRLMARYALLNIKSSAWLNWRLQRTGAEYTRFVYPSGREIGGYVVLKRYGDKAHVCDLMAESHEALAELLDAAEDYAAGAGELNALTNPNDPFQQPLKDRGWVKRETADKLIIHTNYGELQMPEDGRPWHVARIDSDVF
jgi:GNAT superfamily N-acetyltransferase